MKLQNIFTPCYCSDDKNNNSETVSQETGMDRIKRMYLKTDFGFVSPEMNYVIKSGTFACSFSALLGGIIYANKAREDYFRKNTATQFESQHLARRRLADTISLSAFKGAFKYGVKYGSFSSLYLLSTMTAANYNNKITVWEHIASGALIGSLFRFNYGLKGMAAAASAGAVLGAFAGGILVFSMWVTDTDFQTFRYWQSTTYFESRKRAFEPHQKDFLKRIE